MHTRLAKAAVYGIVTAALVTATSAFVMLDKTVTVSVDGTATTVHTFASSVHGVLERAGVTVGEHDSVSPTLASSVHDGATITIRRGRLLDLTIDGQREQVWVTATSVAQALQQIGMRDPRAVVSADRAARVPLAGMNLAIDLPHTITVHVDGQIRSLVSTQTTLQGALDEAGIIVNPTDQVSIPLQTRPFDGLNVVIVRVTSGEVLVDTPIAFAATTKADPTIYVGTTKVAQQGRAGVLVSTYKLTFADGVQTAKQLVDQQVGTPAVQRVVLVGAKPKPVYHPAADGLDWAALARCESGGRANAADPPYYGLYQFELGTWQRVGGKGLPSQASASEQTYRAQLLYERSSWRTQWPVCGHDLFS